MGCVTCERGVICVEQLNLSSAGITILKLHPSRIQGITNLFQLEAPYK